MVSSLRKPTLHQPQTAAGNKFTVNFIKEKTSTFQGHACRYYILVEAVFSSAREHEAGRQGQAKDGQVPLEAVKIGLLTKDPQLALEKFHELGDADINFISKEVDTTVEKYSELMHLYNSCLDSARSYTDACIKEKMATIPFVMRLPWKVCEQTLRRDAAKLEFAKENSDLVVFAKYLADLQAAKDRKKSVEKKNLKTDILAMSHQAFWFKLDFVFESTIKQDFLAAYETLLDEMTDFSFKIKTHYGFPHAAEKTSQYYAKFLKEHLLAIVFVE